MAKFYIKSCHFCRDKKIMMMCHDMGFISKTSISHCMKKVIIDSLT